MSLFATLGPAGSNHELVTERYLRHHRLDDARIVLVPDFSEAVRLFLERETDFIVQCAAHAAVAQTVGGHRDRLFLMDCFIAPSHELAVITRRDIAHPRSIGLHPATRPWVDLAPWPETVDEASTAAVVDGLLEGRYDSGVAARDAAERHPDRLRVDRVIGTVDDAWLVYGAERMCRGGILAWPESPGVAAIRRDAGERRTESGRGS